MIADELKLLVGYGATVKALATMPHLREMARPSYDASPQACGLLARKHIEATIKQMSGEYELPGFVQILPAESVQKALKWLLALTRTAAGLKVERRREEAITALGLTVKVRSWRGLGGPEYALMALLADQIVTLLPSEVAAAA